MLRWMNFKNFSNVIALCSLLVLAIPVGIANMYPKSRGIYTQRA